MAASRRELLTAAPYPNKASPQRRREQEVIKRGLSVDSIMSNSACSVSSCVASFLIRRLFLPMLVSKLPF